MGCRLNPATSIPAILFILSKNRFSVWKNENGAASLPQTFDSSVDRGVSRNGSQIRKIEGRRNTSRRPNVYKSRITERRFGRGKKREGRIFI